MSKEDELLARIEALKAQNAKLLKDLAAGYIYLEDRNLHSLASEMTGMLVRNDAFRQLIKQVVLTVTIQQEDQRRAGIISSFFSCCEQLGITMRLDERGHVMVTNAERLEPELKIIFAMYRDEIVHRLKRIAEVKP